MEKRESGGAGHGQLIRCGGIRAFVGWDPCRCHRPRGRGRTRLLGHSSATRKPAADLGGFGARSGNRCKPPGTGWGGEYQAAMLLLHRPMLLVVDLAWPATRRDLLGPWHYPDTGQVSCP